MLKLLTRLGGPIQGLFGLAAQFIPSVASAVDSGAQGGNIFNIASGALLTALGLQKSESAQKAGAIGIGGLNGLAGLLSAFGVNNIGGFTMSKGWLPIAVNLVIGAWGLISGFMKKK
jgi:hypothetical protein